MSPLQPALSRITGPSSQRAVTTLAIIAIVVLAWAPWPGNLDLILVALATFASWTFCVLYALLSHGAWIRTKYGRHLMVLTFGLALLGSRAIARSLWPGDWPDWLGSHDFHRELIYGILAYQILNRNVLVVASHIKGEKRRKAELMRPTRPHGEEHVDLGPRAHAAMPRDSD